ncbi:MAG: dicarboxylate/amino acid:cation symporter [Planctomycetota bacterium]|nr:dicarboxylate/amino acid:cation symporter [Planctomycetota bacterium]
MAGSYTRVELKDINSMAFITTYVGNEESNRFVIGRATASSSISHTDMSSFRKDEPELYRMFQDYGRSWARWTSDWTDRLGDLFLRMLKMVAIPLIVCSLTTGVLGLGKAERIGKMFGRTMAYYLCTSFLAIVTGLLFVNVIQPGERSMSVGQVATDAVVKSAEPVSVMLFSQLEKMVPANPLQALAEGDFLSIISFTLMFALCALLVGGKTLETIRNGAEAGFEVIMKMTMAVIALAPLGVAFLMINATALNGTDVFAPLAWYMLTVLLALLFHACFTLPMILKFVAKRNPLEFARSMSPALLTAFSSASSNGTLPLTMASVEKRAKVSNQTSSFVLPLGATINMDGTALYEAVAVLFIAQHTLEEPLSLGLQITVALTALLVSIGAAGIPHAGLVMMVIVLQAVGLPLEMQGLILAVDRVLDMFRTSVNVWSDSCGCAVIDRFSGSQVETVEA